MKTIKELYRIGVGPSSSHTMGPSYATQRFLSYVPEAAKYQITLYGSLAATGKGHFTDCAISSVMGERDHSFVWKAETFLEYHPNALTLDAFDTEEHLILSKTYYSTGGGAIVEEGEEEKTSEDVYEQTTMEEILSQCDQEGLTFWEYIEQREGKEIYSFLSEVWTAMQQAISRGLNNEGVLPGVLKLRRKAMSYYERSKHLDHSMKQNAQLYAYALAVSEENASGGETVTAPTCGASGVLPAVLYCMKETKDISDQRILRALATAGLIGNIVKTNASISGAEVGCQGEVGTACAMASAATAQLIGGTIHQIEYAAEMGLEHHLGLTCDPVAGLVQVPCIERNAFGAVRAWDHGTYAILSDGKHLINFDRATQAMLETGRDLPSIYRETALGGLAKVSDLTNKDPLPSPC